MGRWYCCNDSFVSLSTLQEVLSEKVYILFFSRTNQRPVPASIALASNGRKASACNGSEAVKKSALPPKAVHAKASVEQSSEMDISKISKVVKVPSSPQMRFNIGNSNSKKRAPANGDIKVDICNGKIPVTNGDVKDSIHTEKREKDVASPINMNGFNRIKKFDADGAMNSKEFGLITENGHNQSGDINLVKLDIGEGNGTKTKVTRGEPDHHELESSSVNGHSEILGSKRKSKKNACILFAQDAQSQAKVDELKEVYVMLLLHCL